MLSILHGEGKMLYEQYFVFCTIWNWRYQCRQGRKSSPEN